MEEIKEKRAFEVTGEARNKYRKTQISQGLIMFVLFCFIYLLLAALDLCCRAQGFSSCLDRGLLSSCSEWASHCRGFSCCGTQALVVVAHELCCSMACGIFRGPCIGSIFLTTGPPGNSPNNVFSIIHICDRHSWKVTERIGYGQEMKSRLV